MLVYWGMYVLQGMPGDSLDFSSPFGAFTDAVLFQLILVFTVFLSVIVWQNRALFK